MTRKNKYNNEKLKVTLLQAALKKHEIHAFNFLTR